jgi:ABC-2 type transport system ATP-binding protein
MSDSAIVTTGLSKSFGSVEAVSELDWVVGGGSIAGLVGPNGAGKTTLLKTLLGMTRPTSGSAEVLGHDIVTHSVEIRRAAAFVPEDKLLYDDMRVGAFLHFVGSFYQRWDGQEAARLLAGWQIPLNRRIKGLSKGMRAKVVLAAALSRRPRVLLLDEPTIDLDPGSVEQILSMIAEWVTEEDRTVVVATHRLEEVERICDRVTLLHEGCQILTGDLDDLKSGWKSLAAYGVAIPEEARGWPGVRDVSATGEVTSFVVDAGAPEISRRLQEAGARAVEVRDMNLREIFLRLTGEVLGEDESGEEEGGRVP